MHLSLIIPEKLPQARFKIELEAKEDGYISEIVADQVGTAAMLLGLVVQQKNRN